MNDLFGTPPCQHARTGLFLHGAHVGEHCLDCGEQLPKPGAWLTHKQARQRNIDPKTLMQWNDRQEAVERFLAEIADL